MDFWDSQQEQLWKYTQTVPFLQQTNTQQNLVGATRWLCVAEKTIPQNRENVPPWMYTKYRSNNIMTMTINRDL